ncbi:mitochondrial inner membrane protease subunit 2-like [Oryza brachyantha]|uniref:Mitochondrial inner membrane protease subunit 2 n=1 Tax=Oryza brachyantha TaxID=4533 RepID=J3LK03_ORYBR|nr:mitochondrial inner membrane protease subunit 2-like [Oryza brachyantha]
MGTRNHLWLIAKRTLAWYLVGFTISDRYATVISVTGDSMHPTFTAASSSLRGDVVLAERSCLEKYQFSHGDVVVFKCPSDYRELFVKRLIALPGEWMHLPGSPDMIKIPEGHCWVEGDNAARSWDSRSFGPIPLGLIKGRVTHLIWPPSKIGRVDTKMPGNRISPV